MLLPAAYIAWCNHAKASEYNTTQYQASLLHLQPYHHHHHHLSTLRRQARCVGLPSKPPLNCAV
jgi:hypothetical protein